MYIINKQHIPLYYVNLFLSFGMFNLNNRQVGRRSTRLFFVAAYFIESASVHPREVNNRLSFFDPEASFPLFPSNLIA